MAAVSKGGRVGRIVAVISETPVDVLVGLFVLAYGLLQTWLCLRAGWEFTTDDAYITFRYGRNLAGGHGITWNASDTVPVEGYSNFLYVLLSGLFEAVGVDPVIGTKLFGCVALLGALVSLLLLGRRLVGLAAAFAPVLWLTTLNGVFLWTVSGLETPLYLCLVVTAVLCSVHRTEAATQASATRWLVAACVLCSLAALTRPEGPLIMVAVLLAALVDEWRTGLRPGSPKQRMLSVVWVTAVAFAVPLILYFSWRWIHFGRLLPNSVLCKAGWTRDPWALLRPIWEQGWMLIVLAPLALFVRDRRLIPLWFIIGAYTVLLYRVDPAIGYGNRHALPLLALLAVIACVGVVSVAKRFGDGRFVAPTVIALLVGVTAWRAVVVPEVRRHLTRWSHRYAARMEGRREVGAWLNQHLGDADSFVVWDAGLIPYVARRHAIDGYCLNDRERTLSPEARSPEGFVERVYELSPAVIVAHSERYDRLVPHRDYYDDLRSVVADERFQQHYRVVAKFGAPRDDFRHWIFARRDLDLE